MAKAAKAPAKKTSPVVWVAVVGAIAAGYLVMTPSDKAGSSVTSAAKPKKKASKAAGEFLPADYKAQFPPVTVNAVNAFKPAITKPPKPIATLARIEPNQRPGGVPVTLTGGEANWFYTGWDSLNGAREALLENSTSGETIYVRPGDRWKAARVQSIDVSAVTMVGPDGTAISVPIQQYGEVPGATKTALATNAPLTIPGTAITGAIGGGGIGGRPATGPQTITLSSGQVLQLPPAEAAATADTNPNNGNNRRRRRNRNQPTGDPNNGF